MRWLWETGREKRPRRSGLRLAAAGLVVAGATGVMLSRDKAPDPAAAPAAQPLDCASPRNAWRSVCRPATAAEVTAPALPAALEEAPRTTGTLAAKTASGRTARTSSKPAKPDPAATDGSEAPPATPAEEVRTAAEPGDRPAPAGTTAALDPPPKTEPATLPAPEPRTVQKASPAPQAAPRRIARAAPVLVESAEGRPKLARHHAKRVAAAARIEPSRPALQATKPALENRPPARPRVRDAGETFVRFRQSGADTVALADGRRVFVERAGRDAYRISQWKVTTWRDPIDW
jgi:hypothetical protein